jgi:hypothetical protein
MWYEHILVYNANMTSASRVSYWFIHPRVHCVADHFSTLHPDVLEYVALCTEL